MRTIDYKTALKVELRNSSTYFDQVESTLSSIMRLLSCWVSQTVLLTLAVVITTFIFVDPAVLYAMAEWQSYLRAVVTVAALCAELVCIASDAGRFRNLFRERAKDRVRRFDDFMSQVSTTESVLVRHQLIREENAISLKNWKTIC